MPASDRVGGQQGLAIQEVSRLLGVPAPTLRAWELRYGVPDTPRSAGGHRRYSPEAVERVRLMRDEIARGYRAGEAAREVHALLAQTGRARELVEQILIGSHGSDRNEIRAALRAAEEELGLFIAVDEVLMPAMRRVGAWWQPGLMPISQGYELSNEVAGSWLRDLRERAPAVDGPPVLFAGGPMDAHTLRLEALATVLTHSGVPCRVLGARVAPQALAMTASFERAAAVVVVSNVSSGRRVAAESVRAAAATGVPTFYAGDSFLCTAARQGVVGTYLEGTLIEGAAVVRSVVLSTAA